MYLYSIPEQPKQIKGRGTKLKRRIKGTKTKKLKNPELDGGFCFFGLGTCLSKDVYKDFLLTIKPECLTALNIKAPNDKASKDRFEDIIEDGLEDGLLKKFLYGLFKKMSTIQSKSFIKGDKYRKYTLEFIRVLMMAISPSGKGNDFPSSYTKHDQSGKQIDEAGQSTYNSIQIKKDTISIDALSSILNTILMADKENLNNPNVTKQSSFSEKNRFIFDNNALVSNPKYRTLHKVLYFYHSSQCQITDKGEPMDNRYCKTVITFCTKQDTSIISQDITKNDFAFIETNLKHVSACISMLSNAQDTFTRYRLKKKIIKLLRDSYTIKQYIDGCINYFKFVEKFQNQTELQPVLYVTK